MATYHLSLKNGKVGNGKTHAEYILREGKYAGSKKAEELVFKSANLPYWSESAVDFFAKADIYERINGSAYKEFEIALPNELSHEDNQKLVEKFIENHIGNNKVWAYAIHTKPATFASDQEQIHAHIMFSERIVENGMEKAKRPSSFFKRYNAKNPSKGGYQKDRSLADYKVRSKNVISIRESWENQINEAYKEKGIDERVSCKTISAQRQAAEEIGDMVLAEFFNREPQEHLGPALAYKTKKVLEENGTDQEHIDNTLDVLYQMDTKAFKVIFDKIKKQNKEIKMRYQRQLELEKIAQEKAAADLARLENEKETIESETIIKDLRTNLHEITVQISVNVMTMKNIKIKTDKEIGLEAMYECTNGESQKVRQMKKELDDEMINTNRLIKQFNNIPEPGFFEFEAKKKYKEQKAIISKKIQEIESKEKEIKSMKNAIKVLMSKPENMEQYKKIVTALINKRDINIKQFEELKQINEKLLKIQSKIQEIRKEIDPSYNYKMRKGNYHSAQSAPDLEDRINRFANAIKEAQREIKPIPNNIRINLNEHKKQNDDYLSW